MGNFCVMLECQNDTDCDDGLFCNGPETCDLANNTCVLGTVPCADPTPVCDEDNEQCVECLISADCPAGEVCEANSCVILGCQNNADCSDLADECNMGVCVEGECEQEPLSAGTNCGAGPTDCSGQDTCDGAGTCLDNDLPPGKAAPDDGNDCTDDECDGNGNIVHPNAPDGTGCDDSDTCTTGDSCLGGVCSGDPCPPGTQCQDGVCVEITEIELSLDMKPRQCPNKLMRGTVAAVWAAVLGTEDFDITQLSLEGITLRRANGGSGALAPRNLKFKDEATPFLDNDCGCHADGRDGIRDLRMKFKTDAIVEALELEDVPSGAEVEVMVTGTLLDGTPFFSSDCLLIMRPGG